MTWPTRSSRSGCVAPSPLSRPRRPDPGAAITFRQTSPRELVDLPRKARAAIRGIPRNTRFIIAERVLLDRDPANCAKSRAKIRRTTPSEMYFAADGQSGVRRPYPQAALPVPGRGGPFSLAPHALPLRGFRGRQDERPANRRRNSRKMFRTSRNMPAASGIASLVPARRSRLKSTTVYRPKMARPARA